MIRIVLAIILVTVLSACGFNGPTQGIVERSIALQLNQTQQQLGQLLYTDAPESPDLTINQVKVAHRDPLTIQGLTAYHLQGTYDLTLNFSDHHVTQRQNSFDLYLQEAEPKMWRLARPFRKSESPINGDSPDEWVTTAIAPA
jgi:hypothetical protein